MNKDVLIKKVKERQSLRIDGKYKEADKIRKELLDLGFKIKDLENSFETEVTVPYPLNEEIGMFIKIA